MLRSLITLTYSGKIDSDQDTAALATLVDSLMTPATFEEDFDIVQAVSMNRQAELSHQLHALKLPSSTTFSAFEQWVNALPEREPPSFLGLPENAEKLLLVEHAKEMLESVGKVMRVLDESESMMAEAEEKEDVIKQNAVKVEEEEPMAGAS